MASFSAGIASSVLEQSSLSNPFEARVTHMALQFRVDFDARRIDATVVYSVLVIQRSTKELRLDTNNLDIHHVSVAGKSVEFALDPAVEPFGRVLRIPLADVAVGSSLGVSIVYSTTKASAALQWLTPEQTAGKTHPYLFTQCQAIHARSLLPCQDTPSVKSTYSATVEVPGQLIAVMSALSTASEAAAVREGWKAFSFHQPVPMPSYLIALTVGSLSSKEVGPRSTVWAEPEVIEAAAYEFGDTDLYLSTIEGLLGPYVWTRFDLLVLPPSFPYGGMENPCITFVTPTLLAGDRSLAAVVVHEATHSWCGNLVTNASHNAFFLNEGWTKMVERKVLGRLRGSAMFDFDAISGLLQLQDSVDLLVSRGQGALTRLVPDLAGVDPDDAFSRVPYEKGFCLLQHIQTLVGTAPFEAFMHDYVQTFKYKSITADDFRRYVQAYFGEGRHTLPRVSHAEEPMHSGDCGGHRAADARALSRVNDGSWGVPPAGVSPESAAAARASAIDVSAVDWDTWFFGEGMPPVELAFDRTERDRVATHADAWVHNTPAARASSAVATAGWATQQWIAFCERLLQLSTELLSRSPPAIIRPSALRALDAALGLSASRNSELRALWGVLAVRSGLEEHFPAALTFLREQGRMKYVRPLFRELLRSSLGRGAAVELLRTHGSAYHPICLKAIQGDLAKECTRPPLIPAELQLVGWLEA